LKARNIKRVFVAGLATDLCVAWIALDACKAGFETYVIGRRLSRHRHAGLACESLDRYGQGRRQAHPVRGYRDGSVKSSTLIL